MSKFLESLEARQLFSTSFAAAGTYSGPATPTGAASVGAIEAALGTKKGGGKVAATLVMAIATNSIVTGSLVLTGIGTYNLSGSVVGVDVSATLETGGQAVGTFGGKLKALNKKLGGPFSDTIAGKAVSGNLNLVNQASVKTKGSGTGKKNSNPALVPGFIPNQTPPTIGTNNNGSTIGDQTGVTGGNDSGTGIVGGDSGSILG